MQSAIITSKDLATNYRQETVNLQAAVVSQQGDLITITIDKALSKQNPEMQDPTHHNHNQNIKQYDSHTLE